VASDRMRRGAIRAVGKEENKGREWAAVERRREG
jgi:hypothetical protein